MNICMNCGADRVMRVGDDFDCSVCKFHWTVEDEQANAVYLRSQGREPATSMIDVVEPPANEQQTLTETQGQGGAPEVTTGDPVNVPPVEQAASGEVEQLPEVPSEPPTRGKKGG